MKDCPNIHKWLKELFPDNKYIEFIGFLTIISTGQSLDETVIIKYATSYDEKLIEFFLMVLMKDNRALYHIENEVAGSYWWKDAGKPWNDAARVFQPAPLPVTIDIVQAAKELGAFQKFLTAKR